METTLLTKFRISKLTFEPNVHEHGSMWTYKPIQGEHNHEFDSEKEALEWVHENPEIMIKCREFVILPVYHLVLA
jgi:hypothetical protein